jgi:murein L,D-transpeptidase YcbB/YkuD
VRVEEAVELADSLLGVVPGDSLFVDSLVARPEWRRARLPQPVPVHFLYWTAWADIHGRMCYRDDIYGLDERLDRALRGGDRTAFAVNPGVTVSPFWIAAEKRAREMEAKFGRKRRR